MVDISLSINIKCPHCEGSGISPITGSICHVCKGTLEVLVKTSLIPDDSTIQAAIARLTTVQIVELIGDMLDKCNDILDKCNDIKEKCDEIFDKIK